MDTNTNTDARDFVAEIAAVEAEITERRQQLYTLRAEAETAALIGQLNSIAEELGTDVNKVQAFLTRVSEQSGYGLGYLVSVVTGDHRVSTGGWRA